MSAHEARADDMGVSFTVCRLRFLMGTMHGRRRRLMCRGSDVKNGEKPFQLESLILAQNERWRQA